jgi:hypothetical protein
MVEMVNRPYASAFEAYAVAIPMCCACPPT